MKKSLLIVICIFLTLILSLSIVSAFSFSDFFNNFWNKITGRVIKTCTDSDGGRNYYVKGTTHGKRYVDSEQFDYEIDVCVVNLITEYFCSYDNIRLGEQVRCEDGCIDGACVSSEEDECTNYYLDYDQDNYGSSYSLCLSSASDKYTATQFDDCNDYLSNTYPGATEICGDTVDNNCDGNIDEGCGIIVEGCTPICAGKECGEDECGGTCGTCSFGQICSNSVCLNDQNPVLGFSLVPFHEDTSITVKLNLNKLENFESYYYLGFWVYRENGIEYYPTGGSTDVLRHEIRPPLQRKIYTKTIANLNSDSEYEICLNGLYTDYTSTGVFNCVTIRTASTKPAKALILKNYDLDSEITDLINQWISEVNKKNPSLTIEEISLREGTTNEELLSMLRDEYSSSNLKYVVMIGWDLPVPRITAWGSEIYSVAPYTSLSSDVINEDNGFYNPNSHLNEISVAIIRTNERSEMINYFNRLIQYYKGNLNYDKKILIANSMIPSESHIVKNYYVNNKYTISDIDYLSGITNYDRPEEGSEEAIAWKNNYKNLLLNSYEFLIINAHGTPTSHFPCENPYEYSCITSNFVEEANPNVLITIAISCEIGNFMTPGSPMISYIFSDNSLVGVGAEMPYVDVNGQTSKFTYEEIVNSKNVADATRRFGFVVFGDPFLKFWGHLGTTSEGRMGGLIRRFFDNLFRVRT